MLCASQLDPEWERLYLLGTGVEASRRGSPLSDRALERLRELQAEVTSLRDRAPWQPFARDHGLTHLDREIAACALAPEADPRVGWLFRELQSGTHLPTPALVRELLAMDAGQAAAMASRLQPGGPLRGHQLIVWPDADSYAPLRPTRKLRAQLLGEPRGVSAVTGATRVDELHDWSALVLPEPLLQRMQELLLWSSQRAKVVEQWGARVGGGPVALFTGPPGTGKTLAATVIAKALDQPLYRVDLGLLVSKYIGETEKNLNALFDDARGSELVLLFDEADSLFGRRGEVKEARDRYANMEVSHLLSRIERHEGVCILTTNLRKNLDAAFFRRFQFVLHFTRPDRAARRRLWQVLLPPRAPLDDNVDLEEIAGAVELTGGQIRTAALHAAFLAARDGELVRLEHIASAVKSELSKQGREVLPSSLGMLQHHLGEPR